MTPVQKRTLLTLFTALFLFLFLNAIPAKDAFNVSLFAQEDIMKMKISVILVETEAQKILLKLKEGADFAKLASQHSIGPNREKGGNLGYIAPGYLMEDLNAIALNLKIGGYSKIIETDLGYFILMKTDEKLSSDSQGITEINFNKGVDFAAQGKFKEAKEQFKKVPQHDQIYGTSKLYLKIIEDVENRKIESKTVIYLFQGYAYIIKGLWNEAIAEYNKAIETTPKFADAYYNRGNAYVYKGQFDQAISDFSKAIEINPLFAEAYHNRGLTYAKEKGRYDQAISDFSKAIEINPSYKKAYYGRGMAYSKKGQYDQAISDYSKVIKLNPRDAETYFVRGNAYSEGKGRFKQAISDYNKAIELNPSYAEAYHNRGLAYSKKGQYRQAISDLKKAITINPMFAEAYNSRGAVYLDKERYDQAISDFSKAIEINPDNAWAYYYRGRSYYLSRGVIYQEKGDYDQAISDFKKAIEINSMFAEAYNSRGLSYYFKREYDKAWEDVHKAQELGYQVHPGFLKALREASGRKK